MKSEPLISAHPINPTVRVQILDSLLLTAKSLTR